jgi:hypothetical protein
MGLIIKNIGGARPGIEDMGTHGNPCKYSMVLGENEEESPWEPLHVQQGFNKEDSTITMFWPSSYVQVLPYSADGRGVLNAAVYNIPPGRGGMTCVLVNPTFAQILSDEGWTKKDMERFIKEHARSPRHKHWYNTIGTLPLEGTKGFIPFHDSDTMPLIVGNEQVRIVVSGKYSSHVALAIGPTATWETYLTKKVDLPTNWTQLVKKYKNVIPNYARY